MMSDNAGRPAQFTQSIPDDTHQTLISNERSTTPRLHDHYKPVGISAVSAAAHYTEKAKKNSKQMG